MVWKMTAIDTVAYIENNLVFFKISPSFNEDCYKQRGLEDCEHFLVSHFRKYLTLFFCFWSHLAPLLYLAVGC